MKDELWYTSWLRQAPNYSSVLSISGFLIKHYIHLSPAATITDYLFHKRAILTSAHLNTDTFELAVEYDLELEMP